MPRRPKTALRFVSASLTAGLVALASGANAGPEHEARPNRSISLLRAKPDGSLEPIRIASIISTVTAPERLEGKRLAEALLVNQWSSGDTPVWTLDDTRASASQIRFQLHRWPDSASRIELTIPRADDPRLDVFSIEVVDAETGKPVPSAAIQLFPFEDGASVARADEHGVISLHGPVHPPLPGWSLFVRLHGSGSSVRAPGYASSPCGGLRSTLYGITPNGERIIDAEELADLLADGKFKVRMNHAGWSTRRARFLDAEGRPIAGLTVDAFPPIVRPMGDLRTTFDAQATDSAGEAEVPVAFCTIEARMRDVPVAEWVTEVKADGPLDFKLPPIATVTIHLDDVPEGGGHWALERDPLFVVPSDGPPIPAVYDAGLEAKMKQHEVLAARGYADGLGVLAAGHATFFFPVPVGLDRTVWLTNGPLTYLADQQTPAVSRMFTVRATSTDPVVLKRRWGDVPVVKDAPK